MLPCDAGEGDRPEGGGGGGGRDHLDRHSHQPIRRVVKTAHKIAHGYSHNRYALRFQPFRSPQIALWPIAHVVSDSVNLNREARPRAIEIEHVGPDRVLTAKGGQVRASRAQPAPQASFGWRKPLPEFTSLGDSS
jgi:hypothetical protein